MLKRICAITNAITTLNPWYEFSTKINSPQFSLHESSSEVDRVPGTGLQNYHTAASGVHVANLGPGMVFCFVQLVPIKVQEGVVLLAAVNVGCKTKTNSPNSRHGHSEDP